MSSLIDYLLLLFILIAYFLPPCICVFGSSRVESGTEPIEESYDFGTTQEDPSLDPSIGFYPDEPLFPYYLYFDSLPLSIILALLRCFVDTNPICMFPCSLILPYLHIL